MKAYQFFTLLFPILVSSCGVYIPQTADIPLIESKNDLRIEAGVAAGFLAGTGTVSYGLTNNIAIQGYATTDFQERYFFHGALGYYQKLSNDYVLELYGGVGNGKGYAHSHDNGRYTYANYMEYFTQLNYGKSGGKNSIWDYGFGLKTGFLHSSIDVEFDESWYPDGNTPNNYSYVADNLLLEPAIFTRIGGEKLKIGAKVTGLITPFDIGEYFPINISLTLNLRVGGRH